MRKVKITWLWREYDTYYQIDDGEYLASLEMIVADLNEDIENKVDEKGAMTEEYRLAVNKDAFGIYHGLYETNEIEYKGHTIKRIIDHDQCKDTEQIGYKTFPDRLVNAMSWVQNSFLPQYKEGFDIVENTEVPKDAVLYTELVNKNTRNPLDYVSTFLRGIIVEIKK